MARNERLKTLEDVRDQGAQLFRQAKESGDLLRAERIKNIRRRYSENIAKLQQGAPSNMLRSQLRLGDKTYNVDFRGFSFSPKQYMGGAKGLSNG